MKGRGIILAWLAGLGIVIYRGAVKEKRPPWPSELLLTSVVFVSLGAIAESEKLSTPANLLAWGFDIAAFMNLFNQTGTSPSTIAQKPATQAAPPSAGGTTGVGPAK